MPVTIICHYYSPRRGVEWKLYADNDGKRIELYNVVQNQAETKGLGRKHPELLVRMTRALAAWNCSSA